MVAVIESKILNRLQEAARVWRVSVEETFATDTSVIALGTRGNQSVVLKVIKRPGDEWGSGEILKAFDGHGVVRVYDYAPGAVLMERLRPGNAVVDLSLSGRDEEATNILAGVIAQMSPREVPDGCPTVENWGKGFELYLASGDEQIPRQLVESGQRVFADLCASQTRTRLLHGDLQHYNVLFDSDRGWLAIDPKGVFGEIEYEVGAVLRNPRERAELFLARPTIERRLEQFTTRLNLDYERALAWGFAQSVLSAIWEIEDGFAVDATNPALRLGEIIRPIIES